MRWVVRKNCSYDEYGDMMDRVDSTFPYGVFEARYNRRLKIAMIAFWDSDYIPKEWEQWVVRPITTKSDKPGVSEEHG